MTKSMTKTNELERAESGEDVRCGVILWFQLIDLQRPLTLPPTAPGIASIDGNKLVKLQIENKYPTSPSIEVGDNVQTYTI